MHKAFKREKGLILMNIELVSKFTAYNGITVNKRGVILHVGCFKATIQLY